MNKDEKSLLDALWEAAGMSEETKKEETPAEEPAPAEEVAPKEEPAPAEEAAPEEEPVSAKEPDVSENEDEPIEDSTDPKEEKQAQKAHHKAEKEEKKAQKAQEKEQKKADRLAEKQAKKVITAEKKNKKAEAEPKPERAPKEEPVQEAPAEKKKDIKFLVLYTVIFVIVISGLIGGSYLVSTRIHREMAEGNETTDNNASTLKNIQDKYQELKEQTAALEQENAQLGESKTDAEELIGEVGTMVEHDLYLTAAQDAYILENRTLATSIFRSIDREKLAEANKPYYDTLKEKLGL